MSTTLLAHWINCIPLFYRSQWCAGINKCFWWWIREIDCKFADCLGSLRYTVNIIFRSNAFVHFSSNVLIKRVISSSSMMDSRIEISARSWVNWNPNERAEIGDWCIEKGEREGKCLGEVDRVGCVTLFVSGRTGLSLYKCLWGISLVRARSPPTSAMSVLVFGTEWAEYHGDKCLADDDDRRGDLWEGGGGYRPYSAHTANGDSSRALERRA